MTNEAWRTRWQTSEHTYRSSSFNMFLYSRPAVVLTGAPPGSPLIVCLLLLFRMDNSDSTLLLDLPDPCLLEVLRYCAEDSSSLFSAARAHSKLHQAAVLAASSIKAVLRQPEQADSVLLYLAKHGQHVSRVDIEGVGMLAGSRWPAVSTITLPQLPHANLPKLESLRVAKLAVQLLPGREFQGVLWAGASLKRLQLHSCMLLDG